MRRIRFNIRQSVKTRFLVPTQIQQNAYDVLLNFKCHIKASKNVMFSGVWPSIT